MQDKPLEKKSQSPLYQQLMARLKNDILAGVYPSGARIPSEQLLCETYGVSRVTVRKAMLDLVQEGLLVRKQGKGTFVADERIQRDLLQITSFSAACRQNGHCAGTKVISAGLEEASQEDVEHLGVAPGGQVVEICRLRLCDGEPVMLEINRFPDRYAFLTGEALTARSMICSGNAASCPPPRCTTSRWGMPRRWSAVTLGPRRATRCCF